MTNAYAMGQTAKGQAGANTQAGFAGFLPLILIAFLFYRRVIHFDIDLKQC